MGHETAPPQVSEQRHHKGARDLVAPDRHRPHWDHRSQTLEIAIYTVVAQQRDPTLPKRIERERSDMTTNRETHNRPTIEGSCINLGNDLKS